MSEKKGKSILFINGIFDGHFTGSVEIVKDLISLGYKVKCYILTKFEERLKPTGAEIITFDATINPEDLAKLPPNAPPFAANVLFYAKFYDKILDYALKNEKSGVYDYLIVDRFFDGNELNKIFKASTVICTYSCCISEEPEELIKIRQGRIQAFIPINKKYKMNLREYVDMHYHPDAKYKLMLTSRIFHPVTKLIDDSFYFIGPSIEKRPEDKSFTFKKSENKRLIYISLGTLFNKNIDLFKKFIEAFKNSKDFQIIMSIGHNIDIKKLGEIPENFLIYQYCPQPQILAMTDVFITHGGINSINEALLINSVPMIVIPQFADQFINARLVENNGAGIALNNNNITTEILLNSVNNILNNEKKYKAGIAKVLKSFDEARSERKKVYEKILV